jgi:type III restriction enzyme
MDESHRYRASSGVKAINELKPILGLELTATPQVESGKKIATPFKNVIYSYPLYKAMEDGYVKEPAVATRENFNAKNYTEEQLEQLKLEDGIRIHETVKTELKVYADNNDKPRVKPFMLVVAQDTTHAENIMQLIKSDEFFEGRYRDRVITVHSAQRGEEKDETVERLLAVEDPNEPTEIVIHVNMLKEGWDVTNLYTIVPLRAANSRTLVEQSIGRGLRLPYGKRTGIPAVDRLTIVAHDRFDDIIAEANDTKSIIRTGIVIGKDIDFKPKKALEIHSNLESIITGQPAVPDTENFFEPAMVQSDAPKPAEQAPLFREEEKEVAFTAMEVIKEFERLPSSKKLKDADIQQEMVKRIEEKIKPKQAQLDVIIEKPNVEEVLKKVTQAYIENTIDIPRIILTPKDSQNYTFEKFTLDTSGVGRFNPVEQQILIQHLRTAEREQLQSERIVFKEERPEDYIVSVLIDFNDISYDDHADILYDLAGQMVAYLQSYLSEEDEILNVLQYYRKELANVIHAQMQMHYKRGYTEYEVTVTRGFERPKMASVSYDAQEKARYFRNDVEERSMIRGMLFQGFRKCIYPVQKFHSDTERKFAVLLEDEKEVLKWFKPAREDFRIFYATDRTYEPDFVVETETHKLLCEPKMEKEVNTDEVQEKARAAEEWCERASEHELQNDGKPWKYVLIPHNVIQPSATLAGLISRFSKESA